MEPAPAQPTPIDDSRAMPGRTTPQHAEQRSAAPRPPERGWVRSGFYIMTLPMAITVGMMLAPAIWMFGSRRRP